MFVRNLSANDAHVLKEEACLQSTGYIYAGVKYLYAGTQAIIEAE